jgi:hypothetical protein
MGTWCRWLFARGSEKPKALIRFQKFPLKILNMRKRLDILDRMEQKRINVSVVDYQNGWGDQYH